MMEWNGRGRVRQRGRIRNDTLIEGAFMGLDSNLALGKLPRILKDDSS